MIKIVNSKDSAFECYFEILKNFEKYKYLRVKISRDTRTDKQNRWQFQAYKMLEAQGDMTINEYRRYCKYHFGLSIRAAEDEQFAQLMRKILSNLNYEQRLIMMDYFDVTSKFDVEQMTNYINEIINAFPDKKLPEKIF